MQNRPNTGIGTCLGRSIPTCGKGNVCLASHMVGPWVVRMREPWAKVKRGMTRRDAEEDAEKWHDWTGQASTPLMSLMRYRVSKRERGFSQRGRVLMEQHGGEGASSVLHAPSYSPLVVSRRIGTPWYSRRW